MTAQPRPAEGSESERYRELIRLFLDAMPDAVLTGDAEGIIRLANPRACQLFGYEHDELVGMHVDNLVAPRQRARHVRFRDELLRNPGARLVGDNGEQVYALRKDGSEFPVAVSVTVIPGRDGQRVVAIVRDLTRRRAIERELRESQERYRAILDNANDIIYSADAEGRFTFINRSGLQAVGYSEEEFLSLHAMDIVPDEHRQVVRDSFAQRLAGETPPPHEIEVFRKDGSRLWVEVSDRIIRDEAGNFVGTQGVARDISERKRAERALRESEQRYRQMFHGHSAVRLLVDPATRRVVEANEAACRFYGYTAEELAGMDVASINTAPPDVISEAMRRCAEGREGLFSAQHRLKSGEVRDVAIYSGPVDINGQRLLYSVIHDVSGRARAERALQEQHQVLQGIMESTPDAIFVKDREGRYLMANRAALAAGGAQGVIGKTDAEIFPPELGRAFIAEDARVLGGETTETEVTVELGGERRTFLGIKSPLRGPHGEIRGIVGIARDITDRKRAEDALREQHQVLQGIMESTTDAIYVKDRDGRFLLVNHAAARAAGRTPAELIGRVDAELFPEAEVREVFAQDRAIMASARSVTVEQVGGAPGDHRTYLITKSPLLGPDGAVRGIVGIARDITARKRAEIALEQSRALLAQRTEELARALEAERERARRDTLTGTLNHAAIADVIRTYVEDPAVRSLAIAMVDVDGLKAANDTHGHQLGDEMLVRVAAALARDGAIVGRYGGDEFLAVLPHAGREAAERYRTAVLESLERADVRDPATGARVRIIASVGLAIYPEEADAVEDLIRLSDSAMYASRRQRTVETGEPAGRSLPGDRAARMVGELLPFLTSPGDTHEKLRLVAHRLRSGAAYDAVTFTLFKGDPADGVVSSTFSVERDDLARQWDREIAGPENPGHIRRLLQRTRRPVILDDLASTDLLPPQQRAILAQGGLKSAVVVPMTWQGGLVGALAVARRTRAAFDARDAQFLATVAAQVTAIVSTSALVDELQSASMQLLEAHTETVLMLAAAAEAHEPATGRHLQRVRDIAEALARELGRDEAEAREIGLAAVLHDIGKIRVPDYVLTSAATLSDQEWQLMKLHTSWGAEFLAGKPGFDLAVQVARAHHERWDGSGYPDGLTGEEIPEAAAITAVADSLDAMTNDRPYRNGRPIEDAMLEIQACSGSQFSPRVVQALLRLYERGALPYGDGRRLDEAA